MNVEQETAPLIIPQAARDSRDTGSPSEPRPEHPALRVTDGGRKETSVST
jgi:hypothetical protein